MTDEEASARQDFVAALAAAKTIILEFEDLDRRIAILEEKMISMNCNKSSSKNK